MIQYSDTVISSARGRATQMNAGAGAALGEILLFLHIDTSLPLNGIQKLIDSIERKNDLAAGAWGRFNVRLSGNQFMFRVIETMMNKTMVKRLIIKITIISSRVNVLV